MRVGIIIDNPIRDLQGSLLIARELVFRGIEAVLVPMYQQGTDVPLMRLDGLVLNYIRPNNVDLVSSYYELGIPLFVLDTEGGVVSENGADAPENWAQAAMKNGTGQMISGYFFWGSRIYDAFRKYSGIDEKKLHVTGNPRFDICSKRWRNLLKHSRTDYVLVNTNFSAINPRYTNAASSEKDIFTKIGWDYQYVKRLFDDLQIVFEQYLRDLQRLFAEHSSLNFLVRPHPFEKNSRYIDMYQAYENVAIDPSGDIFNVIHNARCVLHLNCGTAVESILLDTVPISLEYLNTEILKQHTPLPTQISYRAESFEELSRAVNTIDKLAQAFNFHELFQSHIQPWFHRVDGHAGEKIAKIIADCIGQNPPVQNKAKLGASLRSSRNNSRPLQYLQAWTNNIIGSKAGASLRHAIQPQRRMKDFVCRDVNRILDDFAAIDRREKIIVAHRVRHPLTGLKLSSISCRAQ